MKRSVDSQESCSHCSDRVECSGLARTISQGVQVFCGRFLFLLFVGMLTKVRPQTTVKQRNWLLKHVATITIFGQPQ
jgi:hypothetical protein